MMIWTLLFLSFYPRTRNIKLEVLKVCCVKRQVLIDTRDMGGGGGGRKRVGARDSTPLLRISRSISSCWSPSPSWRWFAGLTGSTKSVWSGERTCRRLMHASDRTRPDLTCSGLILRPKITQINLNKASVWLHLFPYIVWQPIATVFLYAAVAGPNTY